VTAGALTDYRLNLRYNVGGRELSGVNVSGGQWHAATGDTVGQWMTLTLALDSAEGQEVNETLGDKSS